MPSKKALLNWIKKVVHGWLIFCLGGIGSLAYFDGLLPGHEHGQHPFHLSLFEEAGHHHYNPLPPLPDPQILAQQARLWIFSRFMPDTDFLVTQHLVSGLAYFFGSGMNDGYLLTVAQTALFYDNARFGSAISSVLSGRSALLPPSEKPPQILFV